MIYYSKSEKETQKIAKDLALKIVGSNGPAIIALEGELGAGKTTLVKGFARALGIKTKIKSPTFVLMKKYAIHESTALLRHRAKQWLYHIDCYRVRDRRDLTTLGLNLIFKSSENIVIVEWPERVRKILPKKIIRVHIDHVDKNKRKITISKF